MRYLYGDSTPSPLQSNYLAFVRDAMEWCVHLLVAQERIDRLRDERRALDQYAESERTRIAGLRALVIEATDEANHDGTESMSMRAVKRVIGAAEQAISTTLDELESKLDADRDALTLKDQQERDGCLDAFGKWVAHHQPHEGKWRLSAELNDTGHYAGEVSGSAPYGTDWKCEIELASDHPMAKGIRVGDLVTQIELSLPEPSGWLKKGKLRPQRVDGYSIDEFSTNGIDSHFALRAIPRGPTGLDVSIRGDDVEVTLTGAKETLEVDVGEDDRQRLLTLRDRILDALTTHAGVRRRVLTATLNDADLVAGDDLGQVVKSFITAAAPIVRQIRSHSLSPAELVIRRLLGNDRREELFVSTASLLEKLGRLPRGLREMFAPLGLEWQRVLTPVPGSIFIEPPREVVAEQEVVAAPSAAPVPVAPAAATAPAAPAAPAAPELETRAAPRPAAVVVEEPPSTVVEDSPATVVVEDSPGVADEVDVYEPAESRVPTLQRVSPRAPQDPTIVVDEPIVLRPKAAMAAQPAPGPATPTPRLASRVVDHSTHEAPNTIEAALQAAAIDDEPHIHVAIDAHTKEALAATVKRIVGLAREGRTAEVYTAYAALFEDAGFMQQRTQDQRSVLKLMVLSKTPPPKSGAVIQAYKSALARLQALVAASDDPIDREMIGLCRNMLASNANHSRSPRQG